MTNEEQVLVVLTEIRDAQRQALANQEKAIGQQQLAIERQASHLRLYKLVVVVAALLVAALVCVFFVVAGPILLRS